MDKIYNIQKPDPTNLQKLLDDYLAELGKTETPKTDSDVQRLLGLEDKGGEFKNLKSSISLELLDSPDDVRVAPYEPGMADKRKPTAQFHHVPSTARLKTLQKLIKEKEISTHSPFGKTQYSYKQIVTKTKPEDENLKPFSDIVLSIRLYRPKTDTPLKRRSYPTFSEEFQCLGSNFLTELRDKISCACNKKRFFELSANPKATNPVKTIDPGFFFIEDTFYNDMRKPENADYSEVIRKWAEKAKGYGGVKFKTRRMEEVRFIDLEVSLGFPQLYQHHGNCEHLFTISYVELLSKHNCLIREMYPLLKSVNAYNAKFCNMCGKREYAYIVKNSKRQLHDPAYLCSVCLFSFHYVNGKKVGEFNAYRIVSYSEKLDDHERFVVENLQDMGEVNYEGEKDPVDLCLTEPRPAKAKKES